MYANSRPVSSRQLAPHAQLALRLARHQTTLYQKPIADYNRTAFDAFLVQWRAAGEPALILDAGCGVGLSTVRLGQQWPEHFVVGVDQSADRLARGTSAALLPANTFLLRADLIDFWRLLHAAEMVLDRHYLLYPNPWPKPAQLARRWHGHAVFPTLVALGGVIECRSNWPIYVDEFAEALRLLAVPDVMVEPFQTDDPLTPFEKKYLLSGHALWRCRARGGYA